jgi:hypothetical protein
LSPGYAPPRGWSGTEMPLLRYFMFVGGALLALLFAVSAFVPNIQNVPAVDASKATADLSIIRIHSDRKWPERVVFDTSGPTTPPPNLAAPVVAEAIPPQKSEAIPPQKSVTAPPLKGQVREAFAQLRPNPNEFRNPEPKRKRKALAKRDDAGPPRILVAQQPRFGFFGSNIW